MRKLFLLLLLLIILFSFHASAEEENVWYNWDGGKKYHRIPTCWTIDAEYWHKMREVPLPLAEEKGLKRCKRCFTEERPVVYPITYDDISEEDRARYMEYFSKAVKTKDASKWENPHQEYIDMVNECIQMFKTGEVPYPNESFYFGLPGEDDLTLDEAVIMGYAILDRYSKIHGDRLATFLADAWVDIRVPNEHIYRVIMEDRVRGGGGKYQTYIYFDAKTGAPVCKMIQY